MRVFVASVILLVAATLRGTPAAVARLEQQLATATAAERPPLLLALAEQLETLQPGRAFAVAREAEGLLRDPAQRLAAQAVLAAVHRQRSEYPDALRLGREGLMRATGLGDERLRARFAFIIGRTQWSLADYPAAVASFHDVIRIGERLQDFALLADAHTGITTIFNEFRQPAEAEFHLARGREAAERLGDPNRLGDFYRVLGNHLGQRRDAAGARAAHERSREYHAAAGNLRGVADALQNLGFLDEVAGNYGDARENYLEAIAIYEPMGLKRHLANAHRQLGRVLGRMGRTPEALAHMDTSLALARGVGARVALANLHRDRAIVHEVAGDLKAALEDQRELAAHNEAIFGERSRQQIAVLTARFESELRQHEIDGLKREQALLDAELDRARWQRYSLLVALLLGGCAVAALVSRQRLKLAAERRVLAETSAAKEAAEHANELKTRLVSIASHDLKSPLRAIVSATETIARRPDDPAAVAALAGRARDEGQRMFALIRDLLDHAALQQRRMQISRAPLDLAALVDERVNAHRLLAAAKNQSLAWRAPARAWLVRGDRLRLGQLLDNLLSNAVKFTPPGKSIQVSLDALGGNVGVTVRDDGPGLSAEDFARIFQPFEPLSASPTGGETSTGLGLYIAREIALLHGGNLIVDSTPGAGAAFTLEMPGTETAALATA